MRVLALGLLLFSICQPALISYAEDPEEKEGLENVLRIQDVNRPAQSKVTHNPIIYCEAPPCVNENQVPKKCASKEIRKDTAKLEHCLIENCKPELGNCGFVACKEYYQCTGGSASSAGVGDELRDIKNAQEHSAPRAAPVPQSKKRSGLTE